MAGIKYLHLDLFMNVLRDCYTLINPNLFLIVSAYQKEFGVKKDPTMRLTQVFLLCGSKVKTQCETLANWSR